MSKIIVDGVARPTTNSQGRQLAGDEQSHAFFWRWFGRSQAIDETGAPLQLYHGTFTDIEAFSISKGIGYHFGPIEQAHSALTPSGSGQNVIPVYVSVKNALRIVDNPRAWTVDYVVKHAIPKGVLTEDEKHGLLLKNEEETYRARLEYQQGSRTDERWKGLAQKAAAIVLRDLRDILESKGYDGLVYGGGQKISSSADTWVAFRAEQIKSALGNQGTYDASSPYVADRRTFTPPDAVPGNKPAAGDFSNWSGASKVTDMRTRKPTVVYHGSPARFDNFHETPNGTFFTDDEASARRYAGPAGEVVSALLSFQNPLTIDARGTFWNELDTLGHPVVNALRRTNGRPILSLDHLKEAASAAGYDGAIIHNVVDNSGAGNQYIAFTPSQIRRYDVSALDEPGSDLLNKASAEVQNSMPESVWIDGWDRPARSDRGRPITGSQDDLKAFWRWFSESLVTDDDGRPKVMFHAGHRDLTWFDRLKSTEWRGPSMDTVGSWFSDNPGEGGAATYASGDGAIMYPVYLSIKRPKVYEEFSDFLRDMHESEGRRFEDQNPVGRGSTEGLRNKLKAQGYDGIAFMKTENEAYRRKLESERAKQYEVRDQIDRSPKSKRGPLLQEYQRLGRIISGMQKNIDGKCYSTEFDRQYVWVAFEPTQIKSAVGNNGKFNANDPDIRASISACVDPLDGVLFAMAQRRAPINEMLLVVSRLCADSDLVEIADSLLSANLTTSVRAGRPVGVYATGALHPDATASYAEGIDTAYLHQAEGATRNFLHEAIHAATVKSLAADADAAKEMKALWQHVRILPPFMGDYATNNVEEFVAEAYTNAEFRRRLARTPAPDLEQSLWKKFTGIVKRCLGIETAVDSMLSRVMSAGRVLIGGPLTSALPALKAGLTSGDKDIEDDGVVAAPARRRPRMG
jgi:hypothetical protein